MPSQFSSSDWDHYAECYDSLNALCPYVSMLDTVARLAATHGSLPVLDAGCGTGNLTARLSSGQWGHDMRVTAMDASKAMLDRARDKCAGRDVDFLEADLDLGLPQEEGAFGSICCVNALYALRDPARTVAEFSRLLRPEGVLIVATPRQGYQNGLILKEHCGSGKSDLYWTDIHATPEREEALLREAFDDEEIVCRMLRLAAINQRIAQERTFHFFETQELCELIRLAGFRITEYSETYARQSHLVVACKR